jgi:hypothetical protein
LVTPGTVTDAPASICGTTTMKMMSSTSTTSTSGVTLMSGLAFSGRRISAAPEACRLVRH